MMNSVEFEESFFAIAKLGAVVVPLNWRLVPDELAFILGDAGATCWCSAASSPTSSPTCAAAAATTALGDWVQVGGDGTGRGRSTTPPPRRAASDDEIDVETRHDDLLYIMYTSGTTGLPKGVMHTHRTALWAILTIDATADQHFGDRYLVALPLFHVGALTPAVAACYAGVTQVVMRTFDPVKAWQHIERRARDDRAARPGDAAVHAADPRRRATSTLAQLRWIMSGASPVPGDADRGLRRAGHRDPPGLRAHRELRAGLPDQPRRGADAGRLDRQGVLLHRRARRRRARATTSRRATPGEVICQGQHIMRATGTGPRRRPRRSSTAGCTPATSPSSTRTATSTSSDRIKDMIISGGENIYPAEIENVLLGHPTIADVAVIGPAVGALGRDAAGRRRAQRATPLTEARRAAVHRGQAGPLQAPDRAVFVDEIPRNPSGKALKRVLREQFPDPRGP